MQEERGQARKSSSSVPRLRRNASSTADSMVPPDMAIEEESQSTNQQAVLDSNKWRLSSEFAKWIFIYLCEWTTISSMIIVLGLSLMSDYKMRSERLKIFLPILVWSLLQRIAGFFVFYLEVGEFEKRWNSFELTRLKLSKAGLQERPVSISNIRVGDLVYLKGDSISPADIIVLDTSNTRHADKIFHVSERKVTGDNKTSTKFAIRNFHSHNVASGNQQGGAVGSLSSSNQSPVQTYKNAQTPKTATAALRESMAAEGKDKIIKKLVGHIEYDSPSPDVEFGGSFKIKNDPKVSRISKDNILFCGTKLYTNW